jgi:hypothetical protein
MVPAMGVRAALHDKTADSFLAFVRLASSGLGITGSLASMRNPSDSGQFWICVGAMHLQ